MNGKYYVYTTLVLWLSTLDICQSIMVEFGTSKGPILPREPAKTSAQPKFISDRNPAPVREVQDDIPNPSRYLAPIPHQYRSKLYSFKPNPNLILGTPLDQRYTPSLQKDNFYRKQYSRDLGLDYTGPHPFEKQDYETYEIKKITLQPSVRYTRKENQYSPVQADNRHKYVPEIGVVYSAGVRYYVPQIASFVPNGENGEVNNSVYDETDAKYYVYNGQWVG